MDDLGSISKKLEGLEPGILDLPETLALAERSVLGLLASESSADNVRLKAAEMIFQKHQVGTPEEKKPIATKEDFEHLRSVISEVKTVLEGHVGFFERKYARSSEVGTSGTS